MPLVKKSSRHSKIAGDFGEHLTLYLLSKFGFECARVDHTGIDIIARNPHTDEVMGISVKTRSRQAGTEATSLRISPDQFQKVAAACSTFNCAPYFSIVIDRLDSTLIYLLPESVLIELYPNAREGLNWAMSEAAIAKYGENPKVIILKLRSEIKAWWPE